MDTKEATAKTLKAFRVMEQLCCRKVGVQGIRKYSRRTPHVCRRFTMASRRPRDPYKRPERMRGEPGFLESQVTNEDSKVYSKN